MAFLNAFIKDIFHTNFGFKVCSLKSIADHDVWRKDIMPLISPFLVWTWCLYWKFKTNRYLHRICPLQKMTKIGKFRRNFTTFEKTMQFIHMYFFYVLVRGLSFALFQAFSFDPQTNFLLKNLSDYLYMDVYHGIFVPLIMEIPPTLRMNRRRNATDFFVRRPKFLEPRRPVQSEEGNSISRGSAALCWVEESLQTNKSRRSEKANHARFSSTDPDQERSSGGNQGLMRRKKSVGEMGSPTRNLTTRKLKNQNKKDVDGIRKRIAAKTKSQTIEVQVHGSMSQDCDEIENSHLMSIKSDPIVPIDI